MNESHELPAWSPRVRPALVRQLYLQDAQGIQDEALANEVGFGLLLRCQSFIEANEAVAGRAACPRCRQMVRHDGKKETVLRCSCGWSLAWGDYFHTIQNKQLSGAEHVINLFQTFVDRFPTAQAYKDKMVLIDQLLHGFHWYVKQGHTRPVAINLLQGKLPEVIAFLDELSRGPESTAGVEEHYREWHENSRNVREWAIKRPPD
jgi:hypothetical protein